MKNLVLQKMDFSVEHSFIISSRRFWAMTNYNFILQTRTH